MLGCKTPETTLADHQTVNIVISIKYRLMHACHITNYTLLTTFNFIPGVTYLNLPMSCVICIPWRWRFEERKYRTDI